MDVVSMILGVVMILVVAYVAWLFSNPPYGGALVHILLLNIQLS